MYILTYLYDDAHVYKAVVGWRLVIHVRTTDRPTVVIAHEPGRCPRTKIYIIYHALTVILQRST
jgi:hypothetical protein